MNLNICQICQKEPATYGDGLTWSRCSKCELDYNSEKSNVGGVEQVQTTEENLASHPRIPGLISIIVPVYMSNYTLFHYTGNCLGALREHTNSPETPYELIVVDNGSPIKPPTNDSYYADKVVVNQKNTGYTAACNKGIRVSFGEYVVLLSNDVQVFDGWLVEMKKAIDSGEADLVMAHPMYSKEEPFARAVEARLVF
jgi:hypothetical protein